jgi:hypothetical protein
MMLKIEPQEYGNWANLFSLYILPYDNTTLREVERLPYTVGKEDGLLGLGST